MEGWRRKLTHGVMAGWVRACGVAIFRQTPGPWVGVANHDHPWDWLVLAPFLPSGTILALHPGEMPGRRLRAWFDWLTFVSLDPLDPGQLKPLVRQLKEGGRVALFPGGGGFGDGAAGRIQAGFARLPVMAGVPVIPVWLQHTVWWRIGLRPKVRLTVHAPRTLELPPLADRQQAAELAMTALLEEAGLLAHGQPATLWEAACQAAAVRGRGVPVIEDSSGLRLTYGAWLARSRILGRVLQRYSMPGERVGVLLPTTAGAMVVLFALFATGRVPALLNFSAGVATVRSACRTARVRTVLTARRFVDKANLSPLVTELAQDATVIFLEDLAPEARHPWNLVMGWLASRLTLPSPASAGEEAVILFTSGTEGEPKGVALSHAALLANIRQVQVRVGLLASPGQDRMLDVLPLFHAFGLTVAALAPVLSGVPVFLHPSPLDYRAIAEIAQRIRPTLLVGTDTFLAGYGRVAHPGDFRSLRLVFAGGEPMRETTRQLWLNKFGVPLFQGYGATE
ncbi:MAG: AMP-binding protein, partial [Magnetococcales bacterium]|nr:AMP-binding protein [Magnetococcales bacterium]